MRPILVDVVVGGQAIRTRPPATPSRQSILTAPVVRHNVGHMSQNGAGGSPLHFRSVMETPILDERKWAKVPSIAADCFMLDMEDSVVPARKEEARAKVVEYLGDPGFFDGRPVIARPNNLSTPWGRDDIVALAEAGVTWMAYPKVRSASELRSVVDLLADHGVQPRLFPIIETPGALLEIAEICAVQGVAGLFTGIGDLSVESGITFRTSTGAVHPFLDLARGAVIFASAAYGLSRTDTLFVEDFRDRDQVLAAIHTARRAGYTSLATFYPPHIELINEYLPPPPEEVAEAAETVTVYEQAVAAGRPALLLEGGRTILTLDYQRALKTLERSAGGDGEKP